MANESIFKFADKFGYESPFGDWLKRDNNNSPNIIDIYLIKNINRVFFNKGIIEKDKNGNIINGYYRDKNASIIIPIYLEIRTEGYLNKVTVSYMEETQVALKFIGNAYRVAFDIVIPSPYAYHEATFLITIFDKKNKIVQERISKYKIFVDGQVDNVFTKTERKNECPCAKEITIETIQNISPLIKESNIKKRIKGLNEAFVESEINTCLRRVHFLAQVLHETGLFTFNSRSREN